MTLFIPETEKLEVGAVLWFVDRGRLSSRKVEKIEPMEDEDEIVKVFWSQVSGRDDPYFKDYTFQYHNELFYSREAALKLAIEQTRGKIDMAKHTLKMETQNLEKLLKEKSSDSGS